MRAPDIAIVGGGVIGLSLAWQLAAQGATVTVLDAAHAGQATQAAAGMLALLAECRAPSPLLALAQQSLRRWPAFLQALAEDTGIDVPLCGPGLLRVALTEDDHNELCRALSWQQDVGLPLHWLSGDDARALEPSLSPDVRAAVLSPEERHVVPRALHSALRAACVHNRVRLLQCAVTDLHCEHGRIVTVETTHGRIPCGHLTIAGGAWSAQWAERLRTDFALRPVRGQTVILRPQVSLRHTVYAPQGYLVPRPDGTLVVGATEEEAGYDARPTAAGVASLLHRAIQLMPSLAEAAWEDVRVGLRPVTDSGLPIVGRLAAWDNVVVAAGHGRNGILLAPVTADTVTELLLGGRKPPP